MRTVVYFTVHRVDDHYQLRQSVMLHRNPEQLNVHDNAYWLYFANNVRHTLLPQIYSTPELAKKMCHTRMTEFQEKGTVIELVKFKWFQDKMTVLLNFMDKYANKQE